jgi:hypothetical protein
MRSEFIREKKEKLQRKAQQAKREGAPSGASSGSSVVILEGGSSGKEVAVVLPREFSELTFREKCDVAFNACGYLAYLVVGIYVSIEMNKEIAIYLTSSQRVAWQTGGAFLAPYTMIFSFLEDLVNIKVRFAIARSDFEAVNQLVRSGMVVGFLSGVVAAAIATLLTVNAGVFEDIVYPSGKVDQEAYPDCTLLHSADVTSSFVKYFLLTIWQWPIFWSLKALNGFANGAAQFWLLGWPSAAGTLLTYLFWYHNLETPYWEDKRLILLGVAYLIGRLFNAIILIGAIVCNRPLRERHGLRVPFLDATPPGLKESTWRNLLPEKEFLMQSLQALQHNLVVTMATVISLYVAAFKGLPVAYKINTLTSILPQFCTAYAGLWQFVMTFAGSKWLAIGAWRGFRNLVAVIISGSVLYSVLGLLTMLTWKRSISETINHDACIYATTEGCSKIYTQIFSSSDDTVSVMQSSMSVAIPFEHFLGILLGALNVCQDYAFQAKWSAIAFVLAFVPAIIVASVVFEGSSSAIFIAMYFPHFLLVPVYAKRLHDNFGLMERGETGPWSAEEKLAEDFDAAMVRRTSIGAAVAAVDDTATLNPIAPVEAPAAVELSTTDNGKNRGRRATTLSSDSV